MCQGKTISDIAKEKTLIAQHLSESLNGVLLCNVPDISADCTIMNILNIICYGQDSNQSPSWVNQNSFYLLDMDNHRIFHHWIGTLKHKMTRS